MGEDAQDIKARLKLIVERRNIAHEADIDPTFPGQHWPIRRQDAEEALAFVEKIGEAIYKLVYLTKSLHSGVSSDPGVAG